MSKITKVVIGVIVIVIVLILGFMWGSSVVKAPVEQLVGSVSHQSGLGVGTDGIGYGSYESTSTTVASYTLNATELQNYGYIRFGTLNFSGTTLALPASTSLVSFLSVPGQRYTLLLDSATTTATNLTIVGNTGMLLASGTSTSIIYGSATGASSTAMIEFVRKINGDFIAKFSSQK